MQENHKIDELAPDQYLLKRIEFLKSKIREFRLEIKRCEDLFVAYDISSTFDPQQLKMTLPTDRLDFSVTYWKPKVYQFLYDNPSAFVSEVILLGIDADKEYQKVKEDKVRAIKSISSSLFQLHKDGKIQKHDNDGRRGYKWSIKEPVPRLSTGTG